MGIFIAVILIVAIVWILIRAARAAIDAFNRRVEKINQTSGFKFSSGLFLGSVSGGFLFDKENKKICLIEGKTFEVLDYGYIRSWQLTWDEAPTKTLMRYTNIRFTFSTNDLARPILKINLRSKADADEWYAKLDILFG